MGQGPDFELGDAIELAQVAPKIIARQRAKSAISTYKCSQFRTGFGADSPLEETGFEP
jgi:hypothetical protein